MTALTPSAREVTGQLVQPTTVGSKPENRTAEAIPGHASAFGQQGTVYADSTATMGLTLQLAGTCGANPVPTVPPYYL